ncbi:MAG: cytochrome-c peroxidase [Rhodopirellula sp.]|nr:cytochrome-c peroxidase [Rhodopirellula sp.]|tara:strand:- start:483 stop:1520 length:1038 start_codon:yes stop_codon:yes gene_type:complete
MENSPLKWLASISVGLVAGVVFLSNLETVGAKEKSVVQLPLGLDAFKVPADNPLTKPKIELGKQLYFDKRLSSDNTVSCASCHDPGKGWSNDAAFATGVDGQMGGRSAPTIINSAYFPLQFWDGRAKGLEGQALGPIANPIEMNLPIDQAVARLNAIPGYKKQFRKVFKSDVTADGIAKAIASFERTVLSGNAPYDQFKAGDESVLSPAAKRGMDLFFNKAKCSACHKGHSFTDLAFHNLGVGYDKENPDLGRFEVTKLEGDKGRFKTPPLRDIHTSAPYMHDGSIKTLKEVVDFYNKGGVKNAQLDEEMKPLKLTEQDVEDLVIFMKEGLKSAKYPHVDPPELP